MQNDVNFDKIRNEQVELPGDCKTKEALLTFGWRPGKAYNSLTLSAGTLPSLQEPCVPLGLIRLACRVWEH